MNLLLASLFTLPLEPIAGFVLLALRLSVLSLLAAVAEAGMAIRLAEAALAGTCDM